MEDYKKHLSFCYGNVGLLIVSMDVAIQKYKNCKNSEDEEVKSRIKKYQKIKDLALKEIREIRSDNIISSKEYSKEYNPGLYYQLIGRGLRIKKQEEKI